MATSAMSDTEMAVSSQPSADSWSNKYRGATVEDLDPPSALSISPKSPVSHALMTAFERDYTHLTVVSPTDRSLLGYISMPRLKQLLERHEVREDQPVEAAMMKFERKGKKYQLITMETPLEELESFFKGGLTGGENQDFAVVTDPSRRFVLGVATRDDLHKFAERRPA